MLSGDLEKATLPLRWPTADRIVGTDPETEIISIEKALLFMLVKKIRTLHLSIFNKIALLYIRFLVLCNFIYILIYIININY